MAMTSLWPRSGKQEQATEIPSLHPVCRPDKSVRCGPDLGHRNSLIWAMCPNKSRLNYMFIYFLVNNLNKMY